MPFPTRPQSLLEMALGQPQDPRLAGLEQQLSQIEAPAQPRQPGWRDVLQSLAHLGNPQAMFQRQQVEQQEKERQRAYLASQIQDIQARQRQSQIDSQNTAYQQQQMELARNTDARATEQLDLTRAGISAEATGRQLERLAEINRQGNAMMQPRVVGGSIWNPQNAGQPNEFITPPSAARETNPTLASLAYEAAGGNAFLAFDMLQAQNAPQAKEPEYEWVVRGGTPTPILKGKYEQGDLPYEKGAAANTLGQVQQNYNTQKADQTIRAIDEIVPLINSRSTGYGALLKNWPGTQALHMQGLLKQLSSNIAFNELAAMRAASKTGGALGSVSEKELGLLESTLGAIMQEQDGAALAGQLRKIKNVVMQMRDAVGQAQTPTGSGARGGGFPQGGQPPPTDTGRTRITF